MEPPIDNFPNVEDLVSALSAVQLTEFEQKRVQYFVKAAKNHDWVRLGPGDAELLGKLLKVQ